MASYINGAQLKLHGVPIDRVVRLPGNYSDPVERVILGHYVFSLRSAALYPDVSGRRSANVSPSCARLTRFRVARDLITPSAGALCGRTAVSPELDNFERITDRNECLVVRLMRIYITRPCYKVELGACCNYRIKQETMGNVEIFEYKEQRAV